MVKNIHHNNEKEILVSAEIIAKVYKKHSEFFKLAYNNPLKFKQSLAEIKINARELYVDYKHLEKTFAKLFRFDRGEEQHTLLRAEMIRDWRNMMESFSKKDTTSVVNFYKRYPKLLLRMPHDTPDILEKIAKHWARHEKKKSIQSYFHTLNHFFQLKKTGHQKTIQESLAPPSYQKR